jgi:antitoxin (DNA-binding transcriptional repressor) of toxin-antitoxin stability system
MATTSAPDAATRFAELFDRVERGETITITREGRPLAQLHAHVNEAARSAPDILAEWRRLRERLRIEGVRFSVEDVLDARDEGRR